MNLSSNHIMTMFLTFTLAGCVSHPLKQDSFRQAQWETKVQIKDLRENKNRSLAIDVYAIKNDRARLEVTAFLGFQVASLVMSSSEISYAVYPEKKFYFGKNSETAFQNVLKFPLHPMNLINIAFDEPIRGAGWSCARDAAGAIESCENQRKQLKALWAARKDGAKKVLITGPQFEMQWYFYPPKTEVQFKSDLFTLKQPNGFKAIQIN